MNKKARGIRNNNPANIRKNSAFLGHVGDDGAFAVYDSMHNGLRALGRQLALYRRRGIASIREIVSTFAPPNENNTTGYVDFVVSRTGLDADKKPLSDDELVSVAAAMVIKESGHNHGIDDTQLRQGIALGVLSV